MKYSRRAKVVITTYPLDRHVAMLHLYTVHGANNDLHWIAKHKISLPMGVYTNKETNITAGVGPSDFQTLIWAVGKRINVHLAETTIPWIFSTEEEDNAC